MQPGSYDFEVEGGDCLPLHVILKDGNDAAISLVGYRSEIAFTFGKETISLSSEEATLDLGEADSPATTGAIDGELSAVQTARFPLGRITRYEWWIIQPDGCKRTFLKGFVVVS